MKDDRKSSFPLPLALYGLTTDWGLGIIVGFHPSFSRHGITRASSVLLIWLNENVPLLPSIKEQEKHVDRIVFSMRFYKYMG